MDLKTSKLNVPRNLYYDYKMWRLYRFHGCKIRLIGASK